MTIRTNKLKFQIQYDTLDQHYEFYRVNTSDKYFKGGAQVLDSSFLANNVQALLFERGKSFYLMMLAGESNKWNLKQVLSDSPEGKSISFERVDPKSLDDAIILQLLLNGLGSATNQFLKFNNLTGHLYCFHPSWIWSGKEKKEKVIWQIPCLEVKVSKDRKLLLSVRTLTSERLRGQMKFQKKRFEDYPQYVLSERHTLRRKLKDDTGSAFIMRQMEGKKTTLPFMDIQSIDKFDASKMGVLYAIKTAFNEKYVGICNFEFEELDLDTCILHKKKQDRLLENAILERLKRQHVRIVDRIGDKYSDEFCERLQALILNQYGIVADLEEDTAKDELNLVLIHNLEYYINDIDPYNERNESCVIQHITFEDYAGDSAFALKTVMHELLIKEDLQLGKISLFDWAASGLGAVTFGIAEENEDTEKYFFMDVREDGTFTISEQEPELFEMNEYTRCFRVFEDAEAEGECVKGVVCDSEGNINAIKDTEWFSVPEIDAIHDELAAGNNKIRGKRPREDMLAASLDIRSFEMTGEDGIFYFVGDIGEGMRQTILHAANIRKVERIENAPDMFTKLLPLMDVTFVRNGQLTVIPFPFKYIREWVETKNTGNFCAQCGKKKA